MTRTTCRGPSSSRALGVGPIRDLDLLGSATHRPTTSLYGHEAYPSLDDKAAVLLESLVRNHALVDDNERIGWVAVVVFYGLNGVDLDAPDTMPSPRRFDPQRSRRRGTWLAVVGL